MQTDTFLNLPNESIETSSFFWCWSLEDALSLVEDALNRAVPLEVEDIPKLSEKDWKSLRAILNESSESINRDSELLCWFAGLPLHAPQHTNPDGIGDLIINEALNCGTRTNAFSAVLHLGRAMGLDNVEVTSASDFSIWLDRRLKMARLYKRMGEFNKAIRINLMLINVIPKSLPKNDRLIAEARIFLNLAKAASSQGMLTGMGLALSRFATQRIRDVIDEKSNASKNDIENIQSLLVRSIDSEIGVEFKLIKAIANNFNEKQQQKLIADLFQRWRESNILLIPLGDQRTRIPFRQCWIRFQYATTEESQEEERIEYKRLLLRFEKESSDIRGLAIRRGQYAAMLIKLSHYTEAKFILLEAIQNSEQVCDWQILFTNLARMAKLYRKQIFEFPTLEAKAIFYIKEAKFTLTKLVDCPKNLMVDLCIEAAKLFMLLGQWDSALKELDSATLLLKEMRDYLSDESERITISNISNISNNENMFIPFSILSDDERSLVVASLATDWKIITSSQNYLLMKWISAFSSESRVTRQRFSSQRILRYGSTLVHRIKNHYAESLNTLQKAIAEDIKASLVSENTKDKLIEKTTETFEQSQHEITTTIRETLKIKMTETEEYHSILYLITKLNHQWSKLINTEQNNVFLSIDILNHGDFKLHGYSDEIIDYLQNFYENSTRILTQTRSQSQKRQILARIAWQETILNEGGTDKFGILEISDTGGRMTELKKEVNYILSRELESGAEIESQWHGLSMTISFLREQYQCEFEVDGEEGVTSTLRLKFPAGPLVIRS